VVGVKVEVESLPPVLVFLVRAVDGYRPDRSWGAFDTLHVRAEQDIYFTDGAHRKVLYAFTSEPPHAQNVVAVTLPLQLALECAFFHVSQIDELVLNPCEVRVDGQLLDAAVPQQSLEFSVPKDFDPTIRLARQELPELIGCLTAQSRWGQSGRIVSSSGHRGGDWTHAAATALKAGAYFECFQIARKQRLVFNGVSATGANLAWFYELFSLSFFGSADEALELYEHFPDRGSPEPYAQMLAARYRLLLRQFNEARTILHTLSFNPELGALAASELARSFLIEKHYARALDAANSAIQKDSAVSESYLLRGIALRGIAYEAGDADGLKEAYADFERVAKRGGYGAAEALYHAGTVCARLGALEQAVTAFRQSLFQRDRLTARDALIRMLAAQESRAEAAEELLVLEQLSPAYGSALRAELGAAIDTSSATIQRSGSSNKEVIQTPEGAELWSTNVTHSVETARALIRLWELPLVGAPDDCRILDDFVNRFAPDGEFPRQGRFSDLNAAGHDVVARALALHVGDIVVSRGLAEWSNSHTKQCSIISKRMGIEIPLESFVKERILLGASGDNFSSLESLVLELEVIDPAQVHIPAVEQWWTLARPERIKELEDEVAWVSECLHRIGVQLTGLLSDLETIDSWIESAFEPGGAHAEELEQIAAPMDRFTVGLGLLVGARIAAFAPGHWYDHDKSEGISIWSSDLGRVFPVARIQRRVFLASAADFSAKLSSLAWSVAVVAVTGEVQSGRLTEHREVVAALVDILPSIASFPEKELSGVVDSLLLRRPNSDS
jgi:tetratricopeptide (TPR) repeat protein